MEKIISFSIILFCCYHLTAQGQPIKLRVATYNVGHFNQGSLSGFQGRHAEAEVLKWREWVGSQSLDILGVNEWNKNFDKDNVLNAVPKSYHLHVIYPRDWK